MNSSSSLVREMSDQFIQREKEPSQRGFGDQLQMGLSALALCSHFVYTHSWSGRCQKWVGAKKWLSRLEVDPPVGTEGRGGRSLTAVRAVLKKQYVLSICLHYEDSTITAPKLIGTKKLLNNGFNFPSWLRRTGWINIIFLSVYLFLIWVSVDIKAAYKQRSWKLEFSSSIKN